MPKPGSAAGSKKGVKVAKAAKVAKNGGEPENESEFVTITVHRDCAKDFLLALNLALGGVGAKGKHGTKGSRKPQ